MKLSKLFALATLVALFSASLIRAQDDRQHQHHHDASENLGQVNFPISCSPAAQKQFNRAAALLHSFWYEEAEKAFTEVTMIAPGCAMGYWGIAMSNYHPLWASPNPAELKRGWAAVEKAKAAGAKTDRERDYIAAIEAFYKDSEELDHRARAGAYEKAMEQVYRRHPQDREAAILYALSLIGTALPTDKSYANQKQAVEILNRVLPAEPQHPGVAHYIIHSFDYPQLAQLALPAARSYAKIAPSSPHALHMPTHIFTRLGLWQESIQSNIASASARARQLQQSRWPVQRRSAYGDDLRIPGRDVLHPGGRRRTGIDDDDEPQRAELLFRVARTTGLVGRLALPVRCRQLFACVARFQTIRPRGCRIRMSHSFQLDTGGFPVS